MYKFEEYTTIIYETPKSFYDDVPENRFVAHLYEIQEASLFDHGATQEEALSNLRLQFETLLQESIAKGMTLPTPKKRSDLQFSGKILLRMPSWLHQRVNDLAADEDISINSYIVNRLIECTAIESVSERITNSIKSLAYMINADCNFTYRSISKQNAITEMDGIRIPAQFFKIGTGEQLNFDTKITAKKVFANVA